MALIKCPECESSISDKSKTCIHCGYPLKSETHSSKKNEKEDNWIIICNEQEYDFSELEQYFNEKRYAKIYTVLNERINASIADAYRVIDYYNENQKLPHKISVTKEVVDKKGYKKELMQLTKYQTQVRNQSSKRIVNIDVPTCPKCGSTAITAGQKGYSLWTGFLGSNKTMNRCANCGHAWEPGK